MMEMNAILAGVVTTGLLLLIYVCRDVEPAMTYSTWKNHTTGDYEVVRLVDGIFEVVQTNIRTWQKAQEARKTWEARENERHGRE